MTARVQASMPRSLGGELNQSRRCSNGDHDNCRGQWTAYPDQGGPCECPHHTQTALERAGAAPTDDASGSPLDGGHTRTTAAGPSNPTAEPGRPAYETACTAALEHEHWMDELGTEWCPATAEHETPATSILCEQDAAEDRRTEVDGFDLTRRCADDDHGHCGGAWTSGPDNEGPCECACHAYAEDARVAAAAGTAAAS